MEASVFRNVILYQTYYYNIIIVTYEQKDTFFSHFDDSFC